LIWLGERDAALYPGVHWHMHAGPCRPGNDPDFELDVKLNYVWHMARLPPA
jgi:hypothetical protein